MCYFSVWLRYVMLLCFQDSAVNLSSRLLDPTCNKPELYSPYILTYSSKIRQWYLYLCNLNLNSFWNSELSLTGQIFIIYISESSLDFTCFRNEMILNFFPFKCSFLYLFCFMSVQNLLFLTAFQGWNRCLMLSTRIDNSTYWDEQIKASQIPYLCETMLLLILLLHNVSCSSRAK